MQDNIRKVAIIGSGYVGLVAGTCLSDFGLEVIIMDNDNNKINKLKKGDIPIYEPGLDELVKKNVYYKRLKFTNNIEKAVSWADVIFIAVGTPPKEDGSADLEYVLQVAKEIGKYINSYKVIVDKSTVPIGTAKKVKKVILGELIERNIKVDFDIVSNPEFLREGSAIQDFMHPDRIVIGSDSEKAKLIMKSVYRVLYLNETPFVETNIETAEMIKYACNAFLATKISFINEIANLCEKIGANVQDVAKAMGKDGRISSKFLHAGPGYGGSCFPKDTRALMAIGKNNNENLTVIEAVIKANEKQKMKMVDKINNALKGVNNKKIGILGITFKPRTDDMREAPSIVICNELVKKGARLRIFDPEGKKEGQWRFEKIKESIVFCNNEYEAAEEVDAVVLLTEWNQFRNIDILKMKEKMLGDIFIDLRNIYSRKDIEAKGLKYFGVGV
ncbi:UDP-glucose/GDP-mannose dehydrogenase family protein [uncultured Clostridium sp.]|uniref:UDP-glucose dehydrogenase family protein n=1 Tax=uncultured Clostridium sp. TaxID=59620 RepID=UPI0025DB2256|nr:UDP-glucose/GDP-mannose dehydrogenase family protein [uncultured Clostridium sp.]